MARDETDAGKVPQEDPMTKQEPTTRSSERIPERTDPQAEEAQKRGEEDVQKAHKPSRSGTAVRQQSATGALSARDETTR